MNGHDPIARLRIGMIGSGFIANFHLQALVNVRHLSVTGIYSPTAAHREALAAKANALELGPCRAFASLEAMLLSGRSRCGLDRRTDVSPDRDHARKFIDSSPRAGRSLSAWPARSRSATLAEARESSIAEDAKLLHRLSGEPGVLPAPFTGKDIVWRRARPGLRPPLSGARGRRASAGHACRGSGKAGARRRRSVPTWPVARRGEALSPRQARAPRDDLKLVSASATIGN